MEGLQILRTYNAQAYNVEGQHDEILIDVKVGPDGMMAKDAERLKELGFRYSSSHEGWAIFT